MVFLLLTITNAVMAATARKTTANKPRKPATPLSKNPDLLSISINLIQKPGSINK
jgi:hypothetical protein